VLLAHKTWIVTLGFSTVPSPARKVKLPNGHLLLTNALVPQLEWWCQGNTLSSNMQVLDLGAYDAILSYDWLKQNSAMSCHWADHTLEFSYEGKLIKLQGIFPPPLELSAVTAESFVKWHKGNDIWALEILKGQEEPSAAPPSELTALLDEFADVFAKPQGLPPQRVHDHAIPLMPNTVPVNSRPYRYSPLHKNEIERQVKELLAAGIITHSTSPFASPMLLVQKKDGSWRFCVDYRKLNDLTIKNRFPLPIIEEILDELGVPNTSLNWI